MKVVKGKDINDDFFKDESQLRGIANTLYFPENTNDVEYIITHCIATQEPVTIQGGLTGICGGAVPNKGSIVNVSSMKKVLGLTYQNELKGYTIKVQPGILLEELNQLIQSKRIDTTDWNPDDKEVYKMFLDDTEKYFPNDTTETKASIGGMIACEASGATSYHYGSIRNYVRGLTIVTPRKTISIKRGQYKYQELSKLFHLKETKLPNWKTTNNTIKDVAGLYYEPDMDLIDLFIGSEGLFGVITEVELQLIDHPKNKVGIMLFLNNNHRLVPFVEWCRDNMNPVAIEYFNEDALSLLNEFRDIVSDIQKLPPISRQYTGSIYLEFHSNSEVTLDENLDLLTKSIHQYNVNEEEQWYGFEPNDFEKLKRIRHAVPECVNILIAAKRNNDNRIRKVGTDMAVPNAYLSDILDIYQKDLESYSLKSIIFGHIGNSHLHVNIIPSSYEEFQVANKLLNKWAIQVTRMNGSISAEHGIGKIKKNLFNLMISEKDINQMKQIKRLIEPDNMINQGIMFE